MTLKQLLTIFFLVCSLSSFAQIEREYDMKDLVVLKCYSYNTSNVYDSIPSDSLTFHVSLSDSTLEGIYIFHKKLKIMVGSYRHNNFIYLTIDSLTIPQKIRELEEEFIKFYNASNAHIYHYSVSGQMTKNELQITNGEHRRTTRYDRKNKDWELKSSSFFRYIMKDNLPMEKLVYGNGKQVVRSVYSYNEINGGHQHHINFWCATSFDQFHPKCKQQLVLGRFGDTVMIFNYTYTDDGKLRSVEYDPINSDGYHRTYSYSDLGFLDTVITRARVGNFDEFFTWKNEVLTERMLYSKGHRLDKNYLTWHYKYFVVEL